MGNVAGDLSLTAPAVSPDGSRIAFSGERGTSVTSGRDRDIWVYQLPAGPLTRLPEPGTQAYPSWTPDRRHLLYARDGGYAMRPWDGAGEIRAVLTGILYPRRSSWFPDGRAVVDDPWTSADSFAYRLVPRAGTGSSTPLASAALQLWNPVVSPDGRWIASQSERSGRREVVVQSVANRAVRQISQAGGERPIWARSGQELFFLGPGDSVYAARLRLGAEADVISTAALFRAPGYGLFDVLPGDSLFVVSEPSDRGSNSSSTRIVVVLNFIQELERVFRRPAP